VDYLRERQTGVDYATLHKVSHGLGRLFWRDLEIHHPASPCCACRSTSRSGGRSASPPRSPGVADHDGRTHEVLAPRINALDHLLAVRSFYLDIISIWESKADHDHFITEHLHPVLPRARHPTGMTVTDFAVDNLLIGPAMPQAHRSNTVPQDENIRSTT